MKILLDTDIGSDIDDAVCLAYLLAQPQSDLLGITTVTGDVVARAQLASVLCRIAGRDVPIYPGARDPLFIEQRQKEAPQARALTSWEHDSSFPTGEAVEFLRRTIRANPGEITLLTIGPLTNIALLFAVDPEIPSLLKELVMMLGHFRGGEPNEEWNVVCDPHAAELVYRAGVKVHRSVGLDVTLQCKMADVEVKRRFQHPLLLPVVDFAGAWFAHTPEITFHDPLAAVTLFESNVCTFTPGEVTMTIDSPTPAATHFAERADGPHEVALNVDVARFFERYFSVF